MPKILYLITEFDIGGAEKNLFRLALGARSCGYDVHVAALSGRGPVAEWFERESIPVHFADMDCKASPFAFARLVSIIRKVRPDILHTFLFHANVAGRLANIFSRVPVVVSSIRVAERRRPSHLYMDRFTQMLMDREVCVSQAVRDFTRERARIPAAKLLVIPNPVDPPAPVRSREEVRRELDVAPGDIVILSVGRLDPQKGYLFLVQAASLLASRPGVKFFVAGEGPQRAEIEQAVRHARLDSSFRLLGWRSDAADLYAAADLFVLPSLWEGMPNALLEAAAAGLPVVATSVEGSTEIITHSQTGLLVPPKDARALADAVSTLLDDESLRVRLAAAARSHVLKNHDPRAFIAAHHALYTSLLARR